jgi:integrase
MPTRFKFTHRLIDQLPPHSANSPSRFAEYSDVETTGLKLLVSRAGRKWFYARLTFHGSKRAIKLGEYPALGLADARQKIMELRTRGMESVQQKVSTFAEFAQYDYLPYAKAHKRSVASDISKLRVHLLPRFGSRYIHEISFRDIQTYHANLKVSHCAATANRHLSLLSKIFSCAVQWGGLNKNPCKGVQKFTENNAGQRFLSTEEIRRLFVAMDGVSDRSNVAVAALKLLLLTGMRKNEVLQGKWENVDLERGIWFVPRTKNGKSHHVVLNAEAKALLLSLQKVSTWVFPGRDDTKALVEVRRCLNQLANAAGIPTLRVHDLRHSFASLCAQSGVPLLQIKSLLNHASLTTTQRYAHLTNTDLLIASQTVSDAVSNALKGDI